MRRPQVRLLPDGRRLHLLDGPIDLIVQAFGPAPAIEAAYAAAARAFAGLLDALCDELALLRSPARPGESRLSGPVARRMEAAVQPFAADVFITPMAAVAGAVADTILGAMGREPRIARAYVNNGGDIALHCGPGQRLTVGLIDRPDRPSLFGQVVVTGEDAVRGIATSGWRGRSFSLGIADSVTVLARTAAEADAAATILANATDLPGHPAVHRVPADTIQPDTDLGPRLVTRNVDPLTVQDIDTALGEGLACAERLVARGLIAGAALQVQGRTRSTSSPSPRSLPAPGRLAPEGRRVENGPHPLRPAPQHLPLTGEGCGTAVGSPLQRRSAIHA